MCSENFAAPQHHQIFPTPVVKIPTMDAVATPTSSRSERYSEYYHKTITMPPHSQTPTSSSGSESKNSYNQQHRHVAQERVQQRHRVSQAQSQSQLLTPKSALTLLQEERHQRQYQRPCLLHHPGLPLPLGITQLYGAGGAGKTQLALSLCVDCVFKNQQAVYIGLGGSNIFGIVPRRLQTMVRMRLLRNNENMDESSVSAAVKHLLSNIYVHWVRNDDDLLELVGGNLGYLLDACADISLVILDGIANLFRLPDGTINDSFWQERSIALFKLSGRCKELSSVYQVPFLVVNGVTTKIGEESNAGSIFGGALEPALGLSWNQCVNSTFLVAKETTNATQYSNSATRDETHPAPQTWRSLQCKKSPDVPPFASLDFFIDYGGTFRIKW